MMIRSNLLAITLLTGFSWFSAQAQTVIGMGTESPNNNAVLDLVSTNQRQGFLAPRLSTAQRTAASFVSSLSSADNGLLVFDTDTGQFHYWHDGQWRTGLTKANSSGLGTTWYTGNAAPGNLGANDGDFYINESSGDLYKFNTGGFSKIGNVKPTNAEDSDNQTLSISDNTLTISGGNTVNLPTTTTVPSPDPRTLDLERDHMLLGDPNGKASPIKITGDVKVATDGKTTVIGLQGTPLADQTDFNPVPGQILMWDGDVWTPATFTNGNPSNKNTPEVYINNENNGNPNDAAGDVGDLYITKNGKAFIKVKDDEWLRLGDN